MALNIKQKTFVQEYLVDLNATQAAIRAGYSPKTAEVQGSRLLSNVKVQEAIQEAMKARETRTEVTQDRVLEELAKIAFSDATDVVNIVDGRMVVTNTEKLKPDQKAAIAQIKEGKFGLEVTRFDKLRALEMLGKHLGFFDYQQPEEDSPDDGFLDALKGEAADAWEEK